MAPSPEMTRLAIVRSMPNNKNSAAQGGPVNPVTRIRLALGQSKADFARKHLLPYGTVTRAEYGFQESLPRAVLDVLVGLGLDEEYAAAEYAAWRASLQEPANA